LVAGREVRIPALKEQRRTWFLANELHPAGGVSKRKDDLGWAWYWAENCAPYAKLNAEEESLLNWVRLTAAYTFRKRREKRTEMGRRQSEKRWNDIESAA
jgi:hypothetical protein